MLFVETSGYRAANVEAPQFGEYAWRLTALRRCDISREVSAVMTGNLMALVQNLPTTGSVTLTWSGDSAGNVHLDLVTRGVDSQFGKDLEWVADKWQHWVPSDSNSLGCPDTVFEIRPAILQAPPSNLTSLGLTSHSGDDGEASSPSSFPVSVPGSRLRRARGWPKPALSDSTRLMEALHALNVAEEESSEDAYDSGVVVRVHLAPATEFETELAEHEFLQTEQRLNADEADTYLGTPVRMRVLVGISEASALPTRLKIALGDWALGGYSTLALDPKTAERAWEGGDSLAGHAVPERYAAIFARLPVAGPRVKIIGMRVQPSVADIVPLALPGDEAWDSGAPTNIESTTTSESGIRLGHALDERGRSVPVSITGADALHHLHVVGGSGTGKSTLMAALVHGLATSGRGALVLDPHGTLVQRIIDELPMEAAARTVVVDSADRENPVPINIFHSTDVETAISETLEMLYSIFDPQHTGIIGPRFERVFRQVMSALTLLFGKNAALPLVPMALASRDRIEALVNAINPVDPVLARAIQSELVKNNSNEFADLLAWVTSKFDRFIHTPAIRGALGTGRDAVSIPTLMERNGILLVNLASPRIGQEQARLLGMMWLEKVSLAMAERKMGSEPFFVVVDEAHLFRESLLEEMLAEGRKFGISVTVAHQHFGQLSPQLLGALEGNAASVLAFRSSVDDAGRVAMRLGQWPGESLSRLDNMTAAATLAVPRGQTPPFTLMVDHNETVAREAATDPETTELVRLTVEIHSQEQLVDPYRQDPILGEEELKRAIERMRIFKGFRK